MRFLMAPQLHIPEPCSESWTGMPAVGPCKRHCTVCNRHVHDFSKTPLEEIHRRLQAAKEEKPCGCYHERHTAGSKKIYALVNKMEQKLIRLKLRRVAAIAVIAVLFLSGCARRHVKGRYAYIPKAGRQAAAVAEAGDTF